VELAGGVDLVGAHPTSLLLLSAVLGDGDDRRLGVAFAQRDDRQQADRPDPDHRDRLLAFELGPADRVHRAGERLGQHGVLVADVLGDEVELGAVGDERLAPTTAGLPAEADLEAGGDVPGDHLATEGVAAGVAVDALGIDPPRLAAEGRFDDDPLAAPVAAEDLTDDLVAGDEGGRGQR